MATQTLEFSATTGLTISCKLFAIESDTVVDTVSATEKTNNKGRYSVAFTDVAAGVYRLNGFVGAVGGFANEVYDLTLETDTFIPRAEVGVGNVPTLDEIAGVVGGGYGDGDRVVPVTVRDDASQVVPNVKVTIQTSTGATIAGRTLPTNGSGVAQFNLDDGSYKGLVTTTSGYATHTAQAFVVDEDNEPVTLTITRTTIADPPDAGVCRLAAYVDLNDEPVLGAIVQARLKNLNQATDGRLKSNLKKKVTTDANGFAYLDLIQAGEFVDGDGVYVLEAIHDGKLIWQIEAAMPDETQANMEDLLTP